MVHRVGQLSLIDKFRLLAWERTSELLCFCGDTKNMQIEWVARNPCPKSVEVASC